MAFTTQIFTFLFFPLCFAVYYAVALLQKKSFLAGFLQKIRAADLALIGFGCAFYMWACFDDVFRFLVYILLVYLLGLLIQTHRNHRLGYLYDESPRSIRAALPILFVGVGVVTLILIHFKYTGFLTSAWNYLMKDSISAKSIAAPLGISFITFSAISYLADIYQNRAEAGSLIDCALYLSFFPKVVSGPIVLWRDFRDQIRERSVSLTLTSDGLNRIMIGFAKKLILADTFGAAIQSVSRTMDVPTAFGVAGLYMLQIYYDFSGYSDIAIGLSNMLGFQVQENFRFPYLSCSITEFWRRWHISLGTWFREYIYFPLGGSRVGKLRTLGNIGIVFLLTGIWHGAGWTYMLWGILNGLCNMIEKLIGDHKLYRATPKPIKWAGTMVVTYFCWILFRFNSLSSCASFLMTMFGLKHFDTFPYTWQYYFDTRIVTLAVIGILGATVFGFPKVQTIFQKLRATPVGYCLYTGLCLILFVISILFMVNSRYSPFIYFQY